MPRLSADSISLLAYILVMAVGGVAAKSWQEIRAEQAIHKPVFRVAAPPAGTPPGEGVQLHYETYSLGNHAVCEVGNLRLATRTTGNNRHYSYGSSTGSFSSPAPGDPRTEGRSAFSFTFANIPVNVVNCHVETGGDRLPVLGPKHLAIIDAQGNVLTEASLE